jgi:flagellar biosynthesis protein FlhG
VPSRIISIGGGKGGVGKSVVAANLAVAIARAGRRVVLVDGDLGAANLHTMFRVDRPGPTLQGLMTKRISSLEDAIVRTPVENLTLIPGSGAVAGAANITYSQKQKLIRHIRALKTDVVVIDVGAGVSHNVLDLFTAADLRVVVLNPQLTSIQNAYAFLKGAVYRTVRMCSSPAELALLDAAGGERDTARMADLLKAVVSTDVSLVAAIERRLSHFGAFLVGNQVYHQDETGALLAVARMIFDFLSVRTPVLGWLFAKRVIHESVNNGMPFQAYARDESARAIMEIAKVLLSIDVAPLRAARVALEDSIADEDLEVETRPRLQATALSA